MMFFYLQSAHWNDSGSSSRGKGIEELERIMFVKPPDNDKMDTFPDKYCLFWMCNFPTLLLEIWKKLKNHVNH